MSKRRRRYMRRPAEEPGILFPSPELWLPGREWPDRSPAARFLADSPYIGNPTCCCPTTSCQKCATQRFSDGFTDLSAWTEPDPCVLGDDTPPRYQIASGQAETIGFGSMYVTGGHTRPALDSNFCVEVSMKIFPGSVSSGAIGVYIGGVIVFLYRPTFSDFGSQDNPSFDACSFSGFNSFGGVASSGDTLRITVNNANDWLVCCWHNNTVISERTDLTPTIPNPFYTGVRNTISPKTPSEMAMDDFEVRTN